MAARQGQQHNMYIYVYVCACEKTEMEMALNSRLLAFVLSLGIISTSCFAQSVISRGNFPRGFVFGASSSSYQYEGAVNEDGRGETIWDTFARKTGKIKDGSNAEIANDHYHRYTEDIRLLKDMGMDAFRLSIAWSRIYPDGTGKVNQAGVDHYNNVINALLAHGIKPYVTLYHWELPQALENRYNGWLSSQIIGDFENFAETCFREFGDRVKHWITLNEPYVFSIFGYDTGILAPGRCSFSDCEAGNSSTEPYAVAHNLLLAHAAAVQLYNTKYKPTQGGSIGITIVGSWYESASRNAGDIEATQRKLDFELGWFMEPLVFGEYPSSMRSRVGSRLPRFSPLESTLVKGSFDFIGINHYKTFYVSENAGQPATHPDAQADSGAIFTATPPANLPEEDLRTRRFPIPQRNGMRKVMNYIRNKYNNPLIIITENGLNDVNNTDPLHDTMRIEYHSSHLTNLLAAIEEDGCNVGGYFAWSLLDDWEWNSGYKSKFGLYLVDYEDDQLRRYPKASALWFKDFLSNRSPTTTTTRRRRRSSLRIKAILSQLQTL